VDDNFIYVLSIKPVVVSDDETDNTFKFHIITESINFGCVHE